MLIIVITVVVLFTMSFIYLTSMIVGTTTEKHCHKNPLLSPKNKEESKDPNDFTLTELSTSWVHTNSRWLKCLTCNEEISHQEFMCGICNKCGETDRDIIQETIAKRFIWRNGKWVPQYKKVR